MGGQRGGRTVTGQRQAAPSPAHSPVEQGPFIEQLTPGRRLRRRRAFLAICGALSALVLLLAGTAWAFTSYINGVVGRIDAGTAGGGYGGPLNVLVAGVDLRTGLTGAQERRLHVGGATSSNSDTLMLVHVSGDRSRVTVVSIPRDSWVDIPGHGMSKINAAFGLGGPKLMVATVQHMTGLTINHFVEVNFLGFVKIIDALGGVSICLPYAVNDHYSGLHLTAGRHHVNGITALEYARDRHSFAASDLARISNQQSLLSSLLHEAISSRTLADPLRLSAFLRAALGAIKVDSGLNLAELADQLKGITLHEVQFVTVPLSNLNYATPTGESAVLWNAPAAHRIFAKLRADQPLSAPASGRHHRAAHPAAHPRPANAAGGTASGGSSRTAAQAACP